MNELYKNYLKRCCINRWDNSFYSQTYDAEERKYLAQLVVGIEVGDRIYSKQLIHMSRQEEYELIAKLNTYVLTER